MPRSRVSTILVVSVFFLLLQSLSHAQKIITGPGPGAGPHVKVFDGQSNGEIVNFLAYGSSFTGGVRVAAGDVNGDGIADIVTAPGQGGGPHVKVFNGTTSSELLSFFAYPGFQGGIFVATGDINNDGSADIITGADAGAGPHVKVFNGQSGTEVRSFFAYSPQFTGGVRVAGGDINGDGFDDIITGAGATEAGTGGGPHVKVFDGFTGSEVRSFFAFPAFTGGVFVAGGDVNNDGNDDIVTGAGAGGGPHVKVFDGLTGGEIRSFFAYPANFSGGVRVAAGDVNGDGFADIITGPGPGGGPHVKVFDGKTGSELNSFLAYGPGSVDQIFVALAPRIPEPGIGLMFAWLVAGGWWRGRSS